MSLEPINNVGALFFVGAQDMLYRFVKILALRICKDFVFIIALTSSYFRTFLTVKAKTALGLPRSRTDIPKSDVLHKGIAYVIRGSHILINNIEMCGCPGNVESTISKMFPDYTKVIQKN